MSFAGTIRSRPLGFLFGLAAVSLLGLLLVPPIPQSQIYHGFADQRTLTGIPNFWNVVSNLPFMLVGVLGLMNQNVRRELSASVFFLGVFLTGSDTSANALFGNLQVITATQIGLNPVLTASVNAAAGVMGKMISLTSITVACAATGLTPEDEGKLFRFTLAHSIGLACVMGIVSMLFAYAFPHLVPALPTK